MKKTLFYSKVFLVAIVSVLFSCKETPTDTTPWQPLFDGETLNGWHQLGGTAVYTVRDQSIVGTTVHNTPNSFLTSDKMYGDFILELDYKVDSTMNSGIQIRSNSIPTYRDGRVHGYQVEIDPSKRAWSAGIYDESRRGWLNTMENNPEAQKAFKQNDWNHYRIEAIGDTLKTWINDVPASYLIDDKTASGFICLQVHGIHADKKEGTEIVWKNIKILTDNLSEYSKKSSLEPIITKNQLTIDEKKKGWKLLWDGKTTNGWRGAKLEEFPESGWQIEDGILSVLASGGAESTAGGDIVTTEQFGDFELTVDFKLTPGANSGIKYYVDTNINKGAGSSIGLEYQILDDALHPDAKLGNHDGSRTVSSLYDLIQADVNKPIHPIGEWNTAYIISKNNHVEHWLNGTKVLEYERKSDDYKKLVSESKYAKWLILAS
ncbi:probable secreted glycosyl hydrolase [Algibacter lectus]|uniref:Probable secreted glycosyl hydrolase n=1 Tax=Algibacter lectus TaxID=221126 RepID=A0A090VM06_9FLAO|nr:probable secreted glycosyl hydrolase [Algibacter lectus]